MATNLTAVPLRPATLEISRDVQAVVSREVEKRPPTTTAKGRARNGARVSLPRESPALPSDEPRAVSFPQITPFVTSLGGAAPAKKAPGAPEGALTGEREEKREGPPRQGVACRHGAAPDSRLTAFFPESLGSGEAHVGIHPERLARQDPSETRGSGQAAAAGSATAALPESGGAVRGGGEAVAMAGGCPASVEPRRPG